MRLRTSTIGTIIYACGFLVLIVFCMIMLAYESPLKRLTREVMGDPLLPNWLIFLFGACVAIVGFTVIYLLRKLVFLRFDREDEPNETEHQ
jgi:hypothetical protein